MIDVLDLLGKPYRAGGRGPDAWDCWGVSMEASRRAGQPLPEVAGCSWTRFSPAAAARLVRAAEATGEWVEEAEPRKGLVVVAGRPRAQHHAGWLLTDDLAITADEASGVCVATLHALRMIYPRVRYARWQPN